MQDAPWCLRVSYESNLILTPTQTHKTSSTKHQPATSTNNEQPGTEKALDLDIEKSKTNNKVAKDKNHLRNA
jgi:hypothetical protein